jgi:kumamolisin
METLSGYLSSRFVFTRKAALFCAIPLVIALLPVSLAEPATTTTKFTNSIKEPAPMPAAGVAVQRNRPTIVRSQLTDSERQATINFSIALKMRNFAELQSRVSMLQIIPLEEMAANYFPASADLEKVRQWLTAQGFQVQPRAQYELSIFASGTVAQVQRVFGVTFARVQFRGEEHTSAVTAPSLPADIADPVLGVNGLQPHLHPFHHSIPKAVGVTKSIQNQPPYLVSEIEGAYDASSGNGGGQTIGIVIDTFPKSSDLTTFWNENSVTQSLSNIEEVQVVAGQLPAPSGEETLDTEWTSGIASQAVIRIYAATDLAFSDLDACYQRILNDLPSQPGLHQVSMSYGLGEDYIASSQMQTDDSYFAAIAGNGVTLFAASGDGGSNPDPNTGDYNPSAPVEVENPANDPNVTAVGGTTLNLNASGAVISEYAWSGSGGGQSGFFARPSWQPGSGTISGSGRLVPDVAVEADPNTGVLVVLDGKNDQFGGTSVGGPVWAGICARNNQLRALNSVPSLGLLGPKTYPLLGSSAFRDITSGSNGAYSAGPGYDLCTGIGVPVVNTLLAALQGAIPQGSGVAKDFNNDGTADLIWQNVLNGEYSYWFLKNGEPVSGSILATVDLSWHVAGVGDFLGNGQSDLVWENSNGQHVIWIMNSGNPVYSISLPTLAGGWHVVGAGDFNGDGMADLVWENSLNGEHEIWLMNNGVPTAGIPLGNVGLTWHVAAVGDFLGNGQSDLVWENTVSGDRTIWLMQNGAPVSLINLGVIGLEWQIAGAGDFLGTSQADLVWQNTLTGQRCIWVLQKGYPTSLIVLPTISPQWSIVDH